MTRGRRARAALLLGLGLLLAACDPGQVNQAVADLFGGTPAAEEAAPDTSGDEDAVGDTSEAADDSTADDGASEDDTGTDEGADDASEGDAASEDAGDDAGAQWINRCEHLAHLRAQADDGGDGDGAKKDRAGYALEVERSLRKRPDREKEEPASEEPARQERQRRDDGSEEASGGQRNAAPEESGGGSSGLSAIEQEVFDLLNAERRRAGLPALELDAELTQGARQWSRRMGTEGFFEHDTSGHFAENIAYGYPNAAAVHDGWMGSEGHRRNRMNAGYSSYGIGVYEQGGTLYYTERFR